MAPDRSVPVAGTRTLTARELVLGSPPRPVLVGLAQPLPALLWLAGLTATVAVAFWLVQAAPLQGQRVAPTSVLWSMFAAGASCVAASLIAAPLVAAHGGLLVGGVGVLAAGALAIEPALPRAACGLVAAVLTGVLAARLVERYWWSLIALIACGTLSVSAAGETGRATSQAGARVRELIELELPIPATMELVSIPTSDAAAYAIIAATAVRFRLWRGGSTIAIVIGALLIAFASSRAQEPLPAAPLLALLAVLAQAPYLLASATFNLSRLPLLRRRTARTAGHADQ